MKTVVFFLEELSAKDLIGGLCSRLLPADVAVQFQTFEGKQDLDARLALRLRNWRTPNTVFVVVRDQDAADCKSGSDEGYTRRRPTIARREKHQWPWCAARDRDECR